MIRCWVNQQRSLQASLWERKRKLSESIEMSLIEVAERCHRFWISFGKIARVMASRIGGDPPVQKAQPADKNVEAGLGCVGEQPIDNRRGNEVGAFRIAHGVAAAHPSTVPNGKRSYKTADTIPQTSNHVIPIACGAKVGCRGRVLRCLPLELE